MKKSFALLMLMLAAHAADAQTDDELSRVLRQRVTIDKENQSIVAGVIDEKGARFFCFGTVSQKADAQKSDENTVFEIGSVTKVFTGTLFAEAVRRGEVRLDDPVSKYLPKTVVTPTRGGKEITLLDLATHTSGLPRLPANFASQKAQNPYADYTIAQMYDFLSKYTLTRDIGTQYEYSNFGMGLLGHILSLHAGMSYEDLVKARILNPLDMRATTITLSPVLKSRMAQGFDDSGEATSAWDLPTLAGAGALRSTARDMAKFVAANLGLKPSKLAESFHAAQTPLRVVSPNMKIGLAWHVLQQPDAQIVWHNGGTGGFRSFVGFNRAAKRGMVVLSNSFQSVDDIGFHFLDVQIPLEKTKPFVAVDEKILDEYAGEYELAPGAAFVITHQGDKLFAQLATQPRFRVFAQSEKDFYYKVVDAQLTFNRGANGKIESLTLHQNGDQTAKKIK